MFSLQVSRLGPLLIIYIISPCLLFTPSFGMFQHFWFTLSFSQTPFFIWNLNVGKAMVLLLLLFFFFTNRKVKDVKKWKSLGIIVSDLDSFLATNLAFLRSCLVQERNWETNELEKSNVIQCTCTVTCTEKKPPLD